MGKKLLIFLIGAGFSFNLLALDLESNDIIHNGKISSRYTCDGANYSPSLSWSDVPDRTQSFVLICDDPDAPAGTWVHWVIFNIPRKVRSLPEDVPRVKKLKNIGALQGINDFGKIGYGGPCPPSGEKHRYFFKLYAVKNVLYLEPGATKQEVLDAIEGKVIEKSQIIGTYQRK